MSAMFGPSCRVRRRAEYQSIFGNGRRKSIGSLTFVYTKAATHSPRLGIVVSRKVGNAVVRNAIKRRIRESFRLEPRNAVDVVVIAKQGCRPSDVSTFYLQWSQFAARIIPAH